MATARVAYATSQPYVIPWHGFVRSNKIYGGSTAITAADVGTINNTVALFTVPKGFTIVRCTIDATQMDTSTGLTLDLGDATTADRLVKVSTIASSTGAGIGQNCLLPAQVLGFKYTADTDIILKMHAAASGTASAGTFVCFLEGFIEA